MFHVSSSGASGSTELNRTQFQTKRKRVLGLRYIPGVLMLRQVQSIVGPTAIPSALAACVLLAGMSGCQKRGVRHVKITDGDRSSASAGADADRGGRGGGEPLFPLPDEQEAIVMIQDAGQPADVVGFGGVRFLETTPQGASALRGWSGLEENHIALRNVTDEELAHLVAIPSVGGLLIWSRRVTDDGLKHLAGLDGLKSLWLEQVEATAAGLEHLASLTGLQSLTIRFRPLTGGVRHLAGMTQLRALHLPGSRMTDADLAALSGLSLLESLNIGGSPVTDAGMTHIAALTNLKSLHLRQTDITDAGLKRLAALHHLEELNLVLCAGISDAGVQAIQSALPSCKIRR